MKFYSLVIILVSSSLGVFCQSKRAPVYQSPLFSIFHDRVIQGDFQAKAISSTHIESNYRSPVNEFLSPRIDFKFSINGKDNEMISGRDHHFNCLSTDGVCETPLIVFGKQYNDVTALPAGQYLKADTRLVIKLDMRSVFSDFETKGYFEAFNGSRIYKNDFKGVFVAGGTSPMTWDFDNLHNFKNLQLHDEDGDHIYEQTLILNPKSSPNSTNPQWKLTKNISRYPQYTSEYVLMDGLYNLALEEMVNAIEKDSTLRTGKAWAGVWTRDVSYSIILSMAILQPKVAQYSLMRKVKDGMIIQDTGTGGAYPISTDRMIWAVAAWEIYKVTGERSWLEKIYPIIKKSLEADLANAMNTTTGLVKGESSFLDWREQTYPEWMEPADIFESQCLGTNAVHFQANNIVAEMAKLLGDNAVAEKHQRIASSIKEGINANLWVADKKHYGQYLYGRNFQLLSPKSEALGEALSVLFDIADQPRQKEVVANTPVNTFGIPCIYPQIPNIPPYHNNAVWPFVQSYWALAGAKAENEASVLHSFASILRPAALFLTNKENFVAVSGDYASTQINSDNMLWSLSGKLALVYKVLFGMEFERDGLLFHPFVPEALAGKRTLTNFKYRNATLQIEMNGFGNVIKSITMDGKPLPGAKFPAGIEGNHKIKITLDNQKIGGEINFASHNVAPEAPVLIEQGGVVAWNNINGAKSYKVFVNGKLIATQIDTIHRTNQNNFYEYQVVAVNEDGVESFSSSPLAVVSPERVITLEAETFTIGTESKYHGYSGSGYVKTDTNGHKTITFTLPNLSAGLYAIDFRYANGHGPVNTENKCAIRSLVVNEKRMSTVVLPQRGKEEWSDWGFTNAVMTDLPSGDNKITLTYDELNANMNGEINEANIDYLRVVKIN